MSETVRDKAYRLLLINNRKSYRLALDWHRNQWSWITLNAKIRVFIDFFAISGWFQERIAPKSIEINKDKLRMTFSALNVDFNEFKSRFSRFQETCAWGNDCCWPVFRGNGCRSPWALGMLPVTTSTSDELFNRINIDDNKRPWSFKTDFLRSSAAAHTSGMNCDEMAGDTLTVCEQELLRLSRVLWALAQISC